MFLLLSLSFFAVYWRCVVVDYTTLGRAIVELFVITNNSSPLEVGVVQYHHPRKFGVVMVTLFSFEDLARPFWRAALYSVAVVFFGMLRWVLFSVGCAGSWWTHLGLGLVLIRRAAASLELAGCAVFGDLLPQCLSLRLRLRFQELACWQGFGIGILRWWCVVGIDGLPALAEDGSFYFISRAVWSWFDGVYAVHVAPFSFFFTSQ